jgi:hypothetical protein
MNINDPIVIRRRIQQYINEYEGSVEKKLAGVITGHIEKYLKLVEKDIDLIPMQRRLVYGYLIGSGDKPMQELSAKALKDNEVYALNKWLGSTKIDNKWTLRDAWRYELYWTRARALIIYDYVQNVHAVTIEEYNYLLFRDGYSMDEYAMRGIDGDNELLKAAVMLGGDLFVVDKASSVIAEQPDNSLVDAKQNVSSVYYGDISELI